MLLVPTGRLKHVGSAADESGERAAQQNHHTAWTRPENLGTDSQADTETAANVRSRVVATAGPPTYTFSVSHTVPLPDLFVWLT